MRQIITAKTISDPIWKIFDIKPVQPIVDTEQFQALQFMVANMAMNIEAARALTYQTASLYDSGYHGIDLITKASMAKCFASDLCMRVTTDVVQIFGGYGYMKDYPVERMMRDAKLLSIIEGTSQIHHHIIARNLLS